MKNEINKNIMIKTSHTVAYDSSMDDPYFIQRAKFEEKDGVGIDRHLAFDYMGSSEFENGALGRSLKLIRAKKDDYTVFKHTFKKDSSKTVMVLCHKKQAQFVPDILERLSEGSIRLHEYCDLQYWVNPSDLKCSNDFWWDIGHDWMFWKQNDEFEEKFFKAMFDQK